MSRLWRPSLLAATIDRVNGQRARQTQLPKGQMPELGRPTKVGDELPLFNFDGYFPGTWTFEWDMPEGPLGRVGTASPARPSTR